MTEEPREGEGPAPEFRPAQEMRLRGNRPPVTRLSRKVLIGIGAVAAMTAGGAMLFALKPQQPSIGTQLFNTSTRPTPDGLANLPRDYTGLPRPAPRLGQPLPGDLGQAILASEAQATFSPALETSPEEQRLIGEKEAARTSRLFVTSNGAAQNTRAAPTPSFGQPAQPTANASADPSQDPGLALTNDTTLRRTAGEGSVQAPASPYILQAGAVIPASLITGLRSDLPGQVTAQGTENVYDSPTGRLLLIPQGSRLIGEYDAQISFGQSRAFLVWDRIIFPDGKSIQLERQPGADAQGYAGLEDALDNHWGALFKAAILSTVLSVGAQAGIGNSDNSLALAIGRGASWSLNRTGEQVVGRSLNIPPTITVRPGFPVRVLVARDLVLEPYGRR